MRTIAADAVRRELPLRSRRLHLRPFRHGDADLVARLAGDWEVARFTARIPHPYAREDARAWISASLDRLESGRSISLAIERAADGEFVGGVGLEPDGEGEARLGYWIGQPYWRQGYGGEAARTLLHFAFTSLRLVRVEATVLPENAPSLRILRRVGFVYVDSIEASAPARGAPQAVELHALTRETFLQLPVPVVLVVAVALLDADGRVLIARRPPGKPLAGLWEFPGGKVAAGEAPEAALVRELREELDINVAESCLAPLAFASHRYADFHLLMPLFVCRVWSGEPKAREGQDLAWVRPARLGDNPMPPADRPLV